MSKKYSKDYDYRTSFDTYKDRFIPFKRKCEDQGTSAVAILNEFMRQYLNKEATPEFELKEE